VTKDLLHGNFTVAKVNSVRIVLTSAEVRQLLDAGYDVEVVTPR